MTNMKRLAGMLLALVMLLAMAAPAMAEETATYTLTLNNALPGHTYTAYQIFTGDLYDGILSNIVWGDDVTEEGQTALGNAAEKAETIANAEAAAAFAAEVEAYLVAEAEAAGTVTVAADANTCAIAGLEAGYYLVKTTGVTENDSAYTEYIMIVVEDTEVKIKSSVPTVEKKVDDKNDSNTEEDETAWHDSADYDIGDAVPYKLTATLADNVESYDSYSIKFVDTLTAGLTYNNDAEVKFGDVDVTGHFTITLDENNVLTIACDNVKAEGFGATNSSVIEVFYTATLNENAVVGSAGNPNSVYLEYSNNPNYTGEGEEDTGRTPEDKVTVFTFKVIVNKTDAEGKALAGAGFTLYKKNAEGVYAAIGEELKAAEMTTFEWTGLDAGDYKLEETTTPAGYNTIDAIEFTITATHEIESDDPELKTLTGDVAGVIVVEGEEAEETFNVAPEAGTLTTDVVNTTGATLPSTGGMGTTVIYIAGGALVLAAIIILVAKKRAGSEK